MTILRSTMLPSSEGGFQIGDQMQFMDVGTTYTNQLGYTFLRSGVWVSPASAPTAATIEYLKATGVATGTVAASLSSTNFDIATDGAGRWVIAYGNATNVQVSTDNGATWALVAHSAGGVVTSVCYTSIGGGLFIAGGNSTTQFWAASVAAASVGSAWTVRTGSAITGGTANTTRVRASSAEVVMVCGAGTTGNASRSTNGTSWTAANISVALSATDDQNCLCSLGGGIWITCSESATGNRSTDGGATWSSVTYPVAINNAAFGSSILLVSSASSGMYTSATGATGSFTSIGKALGAYVCNAANYGLSLQHNGTVFIASIYNSSSTTAGLGFYGTSSDGVTWAIKTSIGRSWADSTSSTPGTIYVDADGDYVMAPTRLTHNSTLMRGNLSTTTGVGFNVVRPTSTGLPTPTLYVRIT